MKKFSSFAIILFILLSNCVSYASDFDVYQEQYEIFEIHKLISDAPDAANEIEFEKSLDFNKGIFAILNKIKEDFGKIFMGGLQSVLSITAISIICGSITLLSPSKENKTVKTVASFIGAVAVLAVCSDNISGIIGMSENFINEIDVFSKTLLPTVAATEAACGMMNSAIARANIALLFSDILITVIKNIFFPITYIIIFASITGSASENNSLSIISDFMTSTVGFILKVFLGVYISYISVAGIVTSGTDYSGLKTVKLAIGGVVPVVGPLVAESAETVLSGVMMMKNLVGVFGILVILSSFATPFITLLLNYFLFKFASVCASPVISKNITGLTAQLSKIFGLILGMCGSVATVIFIAIISAMRSVAFI